MKRKFVITSLLNFSEFNPFVFIVKDNIEAREDVHSAEKKGSRIIFAKETSDRKFISGDFNGNVVNVYI